MERPGNRQEKRNRKQCMVARLRVTLLLERDDKRQLNLLQQAESS